MIANRVHGSVVQRLQAYGDWVLNETEIPLSAEELRRRCSGASAVMAFMTERVDEEFLSACPHLSIVAGALKGSTTLMSMRAPAYYDPHRLGEDTEAFLKCRFVDQSILVREANILVLAVHLMDCNRRLVYDDEASDLKLERMGH